jgi:hypothetical protein
MREDAPILQQIPESKHTVFVDFKSLREISGLAD